MFDLATLYGFWSGPADCFGRYFEYKGKQGVKLMADVLRKARSLDTYKPKKKKGAKKSKSFSSSLSLSFSRKSSSSSSAGEVGPARSKSAPAELVRVGSAKAAPEQKQKAGGKKAQKAVPAGAAASAAVAAAGTVALAQADRAPSEASSLITTATNPPGAPSLSISDESSVREAPSDAASYVSASSTAHSPTHSSERNVQGSPCSVRLSSSDSDTA